MQKFDSILLVDDDSISLYLARYYIDEIYDYTLTTIYPTQVTMRNIQIYHIWKDHVIWPYSTAFLRTLYTK